ncbi:Bug family tripartite tricarboxylate transporter substrate binding protein [Verminephrobacter eiseniae]|uniref:Bug family tripartite tricarboxylate transporter substrate binding protein n=1 Tax=Verminephrobacter eiseniae TaxID=364317 RepID=UPI00223851F9|nr:tripartite tricarboxylate transporter substrate binding protein [Verminephrobacter eiseniae]
MSHSIVRLRARRPFVALAFALATASAALGVLLALAHTQAMAQDYPVRPVRIVSVTSAGSGVDGFSRLMASYLGKRLGQGVFIENRPGANSILACDHVAKAAPDGYTLLLASASALAANPYLFKNLPYDANKDFAPIARLSALPVTIVVPATSPYRSLADLADAARDRPGKLNFGTSTTGYRTMLGAINGAARIDAVDVPYKGTSHLLPDLVGGTIDYGILEVSTAVPLVRANKLRALVVTSPARVATLEDVPTLAEAGLGEATLVSWVGLFAPAGTPQPVIDKLSMLALEFVQTPEAAAHFAQLGTIAYPAGASEFAKAIVKDQAQWKRYITAAGIQAE